MDDMEIRKQIDKYIKEICHYSQMQVFATSAYQKRFLQYQIDETANGLADFFLVQSEPAMYRQQLQQSDLQELEFDPQQEQSDLQLVQVQPQSQQPVQPQQPTTQPQPVQPQPMTQPQPVQPQPMTQPQPVQQQPATQPLPTQPQQAATQTQPGSLVITIEELAKNDGSRGNKAYVAVNGKVYDVSMLGGWAGGTHFGLYAGKDLTSEFLGCHRSMLEVLQRAPVIGTLKKE